MFSFGRSSSSRAKAGSDVPKTNRRDRDDADDNVSTVSSKRKVRTNASSTSLSKPRRKSSRREDDDDDAETVYSTSSKHTRSGTAPSASSTYVTAQPRGEDSSEMALVLKRNDARDDISDRRGEEDRRSTRKDSRNSKSERRRTQNDYDDQTRLESYDGRRWTADYDDRRRSTNRSDSDAPRRKSQKRIDDQPYSESRAIGDHDSVLPQNQFFSDPATYTAPYRPPNAGLAADYYGDQGESVQHQPGVRPQGPGYVVNQEQLHLHPPTTDAKPPPEPSASGQLGAAASFYAMNSGSEAEQSTPAKPSQPGQSSQIPAKVKLSPRASPDLVQQSSSGVNIMAAAAVGAGAATGAGAAMDYFNSSAHGNSNQQYNTGYSSVHDAGPQAQQLGDMYDSSLRPPQPSRQDSGHHYGTAAAMGLAGAAAGAYLHHQHNQHQQQSQQGVAGSHLGGPYPNFQLGQNQSAFPNMQQQKMKRKNTGPFSRLARWWNAPDDVAQFEEWSEYIGVCRYCFDPNCPPGNGPRKHHYHRKLRREQSKYGSNLRVDKTYRHSSSDDEWKKRSSRAKKAAAVGLAGLGAAKVGETLYNSRHDFDDTYSVKSGKPIVQQRTSYSRQDGASQEDLRRKSSRSKLDRENGERKHRRRRSSDALNEGVSRGNVMSVGVGAAGLALAAEAAHRRRSRSRSGDRASTRKRYYSKRVSPQHSYVDLTTTEQGTAGFGAFFSSPSANSKSGKKPKGFFTFANDSSSSSDADLAFGEGTIKRRSAARQDEREERRRKEKYGGSGHDTAAIMGLAAAGTALAAQASRKGKDRKYADFVVDSRTGKKIKLHDHETATNGNDDGWEDASDGESQESVDIALAYGGRFSASQSKESLASQSSGTGKWDWRWNKNKKQRAEKKLQRRQSMELTQRKTELEQQADEMIEPPDIPFARKSSAQVNPFFKAGAAGVALGALGAAAADLPHNPSPMSQPSMQFVDPIPISESVTPSAPLPEFSATASQVRLEQPQPQNPPQARRIESLALRDQISPLPDSVYHRESRPREDFEDRKVTSMITSAQPPSPTLPPINPSTWSKNSVTFDLTPEQLESEQRVLEKDERRRRKREKVERRKTADVAELQHQAEEAQRRKTEETERHENGRKPSRRASVGETARSEADIDAEIARLRAEQKRKKEESRRQEEEQDWREREKRRQSEDRRLQQDNDSALADYGSDRPRTSGFSDVAVAAAAVAAGAAIGSAMADGRKDSIGGEKKPRRRSSLKNEVDEAPSTVEAVRESWQEERPVESQQERIARKAARRVSRSPSPVYEDYSKFFVPEEIASRVREHNYAAEHRDDIGANVVEIAPPSEASGTGSSTAKRKSPFSPDKYRPFGLEPDHDPLRFPWKVPLLSLVEPTPPGSRTMSERDPHSPLVQPASPKSQPPEEEIGKPLERKRSGSKVRWGDHDTWVYEVRTPEYEPGDPVDQLKDHENNNDDEKSKDETVSPDPEDFYTGRTTAQEHSIPPADVYSARPKPERAYTLDDDKQKAEFVQNSSVDGHETPAEPYFSMPGGMPEIGKPFQEDHPLEEQFRDAPLAESTPVQAGKQNEPLGKIFYESPFAQPVSDLDTKSTQQPAPELRRVETLPDTTPVEDVYEQQKPEMNGAEASRPSRSEARRMERALSGESTELTLRDAVRDSVPQARDIPPAPPLPPATFMNSTTKPESGRGQVEDPKPTPALRSSFMDVAAAAAAASAERTRKRQSMSGVPEPSKSAINLGSDTKKPISRERASSLSDKAKTNGNDVFDYLVSSSSDDKTTGRAKSQAGTSKTPESTSKAAMIAAASAAIGGITARRIESDNASKKDAKDLATRGPATDFKVEYNAAKSDVAARDQTSRDAHARRFVPDFSAAKSNHVEQLSRGSEPGFYASMEDAPAVVTAEPDFYADTAETGRREQDVASEPGVRQGEAAKPKKRKSKQGSEIFDEYDPSRSIASLPGTKHEESKLRTRSKKGDYDLDDDDTRSVASTTVLRDEERKSRRKSKKGSEVADDDDNRSVTSTPAEGSKRRSKRGDYGVDDDDTRSVKSSSSRSERKSRDRDSKRGSGVWDDDDDTRSVRSSSSKKDKKERDEKKSNGFFSSIFSGSKTDISTPKRKDSKSSRSEAGSSRRDDSTESKHRKRHHSKSSVIADVPALSKPPADYEISPDISRRNTEELVSESRDRSTDDGFVSAQDEQSFLGVRPGMPLPTAIMDGSTGTDGVSGLTNIGTEARRHAELQPGTTMPDEESANRLHEDAPTISDLLSNHPRALSIVQPEQAAVAPADGTVDSGEETAFEVSDKPTASRPRALSVAQMTPSQEGKTTESPTSVRVPLFRKPLTTPRSATKEFASSPITQTPSSPLQTPRVRHARQKSSEVRSGEVRPLYLVQMHPSSKAETPIPEEQLPSLPSSRTTSIYGSTEDLPRLASGVVSDSETESKRGRAGRRHSWQGRAQSLSRGADQPLDSRSVTPVPGERQRQRDRELQQLKAQAQQRERRELPKHFFHSPSELLQDPATFAELDQEDVVARLGSPLPSVVSTIDDEFLSAESRPDTPTADWNRSLPAPAPVAPERKSSSSRSPPATKRGDQTARRPSSSDRSLPQNLASKSPVASGVVTPPSRSQSASPFKHRTSSGIAARAAAMFGGAGLGLAIANTVAASADKDKSRDADIPLPEESFAAQQDDSQPSISLTQPTPIEPIAGQDLAADESSARELIIKNPEEDKENRTPRQSMIRESTAEPPLSLNDLNTAPDNAVNGKSQLTEVLARTVVEQAQVTAASPPPEAISPQEQPAEVGDAVAMEGSGASVPLKSPRPDEVTDRSSLTRDAYIGAEFPRRERIASFVPTTEEIEHAYHDLSAFELAFAKALHARGLNEGVAREEALEAFLPKRNNAPFVPKDKLSPIAGSLPSSQVNSPTEQQSRAASEAHSSKDELTGDPDHGSLQMHMAGKKPSKKSNRKERKKIPSSRLSQEFTSDEVSEELSQAGEVEQAEQLQTEELDTALQKNLKRRSSHEIESPVDVGSNAQQQREIGPEHELHLKSTEATDNSQTIAEHIITPALATVGIVAAETVSDRRDDVKQNESWHAELAPPSADAQNSLEELETSPIDKAVASEPPEKRVGNDPADQIPWDFGLNKKQRKKKENTMKADGTWDSRITLEMINTAAAAKEGQGDDSRATENDDDTGSPSILTESVGDIHPAPSNDVVVENQVPWDFGLSSKERKRKEKAMKKDGTWESRKTQEPIDNAPSSETSKAEDVTPPHAVVEQPTVIGATQAESATNAEWATASSNKESNSLNTRAINVSKEPPITEIAAFERSTSDSNGNRAAEHRGSILAESFDSTLADKPTESIQDQVTKPQISDNFTPEESKLEVGLPSWEANRQVGEDEAVPSAHRNQDPRLAQEPIQTTVPGIVLQLLNRRQSIGEASRPRSSSTHELTKTISIGATPSTFEPIFDAAETPLQSSDQTAGTNLEPLLSSTIPAVEQAAPSDKFKEEARELEQPAKAEDGSSGIPLSTSVDDTPAPTEDDAWAAPKKSKKKDKKKRKSSTALTTTEDDQTGPGVLQEIQAEPVIATGIVAEPTEIIEPVTGPDVAEETRERSADLEDANINPGAVTTDSQTHPQEQSLAASPTHAQNEADEEDWGFSTKKSKKDKKKSKKSRAQSVDEPSEENSRASEGATQVTSTTEEVPAKRQGEPVDARIEDLLPWDHGLSSKQRKKREKDLKSSGQWDNRLTQEHIDQIMAGRAGADEEPAGTQEDAAVATELPAVVEGTKEISADHAPKPDTSDANDEVAETEGVLSKEAEAEALPAVLELDAADSAELTAVPEVKLATTKSPPEVAVVQGDNKRSIDFNPGKLVKDDGTLHDARQLHYDPIHQEWLAGVHEMSTQYPARPEQPTQEPMELEIAEQNLPGADWTDTPTMEQARQEHPDSTVDEFFETPKSPKDDGDMSWAKGNKKSKKGTKAKKASVSSILSSENATLPSTVEKDLELSSDTTAKSMEIGATTSPNATPQNQGQGGGTAGDESKTLAESEKHGEAAVVSGTPMPVLDTAFDPVFATPVAERSVDPFDEVATKAAEPTDVDETEAHPTSVESPYPSMSRKSSKREKKRKSVVWADADSVPGTPANESGLELIVPPSPERTYDNEPSATENVLAESSSRAERKLEDITPEPEQMASETTPAQLLEGEEATKDLLPEDEWSSSASSSKKGKREKKKKKKASLSEPESESSLEKAPLVGTVTTPFIAQAETARLDDVGGPELSGTSVDSQEAGDDEWSTSASSKKKKKDKKKTKKGSTSAPEAETERTSESLIELDKSVLPVADMPADGIAAQETSTQVEIPVEQESAVVGTEKQIDSATPSTTLPEDIMRDEPVVDTAEKATIEDEPEDFYRAFSSEVQRSEPREQILDDRQEPVTTDREIALVVEEAPEQWYRISPTSSREEIDPTVVPDAARHELMNELVVEEVGVEEAGVEDAGAETQELGLTVQTSAEPRQVEIYSENVEQESEKAQDNRAEDEWSVPVKATKNGKKNRTSSKAGTSNTGFISEGQSESGEISVEPEQIDEVTDGLQSVESTVAETAAEDEWATSGKKSKKDKKKKKRQSKAEYDALEGERGSQEATEHAVVEKAMTEIDQTKQEQVELPLNVDATEETVLADEGAKDVTEIADYPERHEAIHETGTLSKGQETPQNTLIGAEADPTTTAEVTEADDTEWATSTKKSKKNRKKSKKQQLILLDDKPETAVEPEQIESETMAKDNITGVTQVEDAPRSIPEDHQSRPHEPGADIQVKAFDTESRFTAGAANLDPLNEDETTADEPGVRGAKPQLADLTPASENEWSVPTYPNHEMDQKNESVSLPEVEKEEGVTPPSDLTMAYAAKGEAEADRRESEDANSRPSDAIKEVPTSDEPQISEDMTLKTIHSVDDVAKGMVGTETTAVGPSSVGVGVEAPVSAEPSTACEETGHDLDVEPKSPARHSWQDGSATLFFGEAREVPESATGEVVAEDEWSTPQAVKKSKRDKKKKKRRSLMDDESEPSTEAEVATPNVTEGQREAQALKETTELPPMSDKSTLVTEPDVDTGAVASEERELSRPSLETTPTVNDEPMIIEEPIQALEGVDNALLEARVERTPVAAPTGEDESLSPSTSKNLTENIHTQQATKDQEAFATYDTAIVKPGEETNVVTASDDGQLDPSTQPVEEPIDINDEPFIVKEPQPADVTDEWSVPARKTKKEKKKQRKSTVREVESVPETPVDSSGFATPIENDGSTEERAFEHRDLKDVVQHAQEEITDQSMSNAVPGGFIEDEPYVPSVAHAQVEPTHRTMELEPPTHASGEESRDIDVSTENTPFGNTIEDEGVVPAKKSKKEKKKNKKNRSQTIAGEPEISATDNEEKIKPEPIVTGSEYPVEQDKSINLEVMASQPADATHYDTHPSTTSMANEGKLTMDNFVLAGTAATATAAAAVGAVAASHDKEQDEADNLAAWLLPSSKKSEKGEGEHRKGVTEASLEPTVEPSRNDEEVEGQDVRMLDVVDGSSLPMLDKAIVEIPVEMTDAAPVQIIGSLPQHPVTEEPAEDDEWALPKRNKKSKKDKQKRKSTSGAASSKEGSAKASISDIRQPSEGEIDRNPPREHSIMMADEDSHPQDKLETFYRDVEPTSPSGPNIWREPEPELFYKTDATLSQAVESREAKLAAAPLSRQSSKSRKGQVSARSSTDIAVPKPSNAMTHERAASPRVPRKASKEWVAQPVATEQTRAEDSDGSQVSDTTRERRRKRRSPQMWAGGEPDDLPRSPSRALTPPPDHDDIMDTALGIAAGLGLGAAATQTVPEVTRRERNLRSEETSEWSFDRLDQLRASARDSGIHESPELEETVFGPHRDSGIVASPPHVSQHQGKRSVNSLHESRGHPRSSRPRSPASSSESLQETARESAMSPETPLKRQPSPVESTSKDRTSALFKSSPAGPAGTPKTPSELAHLAAAPTSTQRGPAEFAHLQSPASAGNRKASPSLRMVRDSHGNLRESTTSPSSLRGQRDSFGNLRAIAGSPHSPRQSDELASNLIDRVQTREVDRQRFSPSPRQSTDRPFSPRGSTDRPFSPRALGTIDENGLAIGALAAGLVGGAVLMSREQTSPGLGGTKSRTASLRSLRQNSTSPTWASQQTAGQAVDVAAQGADRSASMAEYSFDGVGAAVPQSPRSPSRPPSLRKQQSLNQVLDLQNRVEQLAAENRSLAEAKLLAEQHIQELHLEHTKADYATEEALKTVNEQLRVRDEEIVSLRAEIENIAKARDALRDEHEEKYTLLLNEKDTTHNTLQDSSRELEALRSKHHELSSGMEGVVAAQVAAAIATKDEELQRLRRELDSARAKIRELQSKILASGVDDIVVVRDEDYFDSACQQLCQHVQQWVLRFSKFSDTRVCRSTSEVRDEKIVDRFDNAILDGSDVDVYLADRVKRRDVFMSVVMTMIWEFVFTRYLFGMDREQRQRLKQLEKNLADVGPASAVQQWRALTLTLLAKRQQFKQQKEADTEAVATEILQTLSKFLPPPQNLESQIFESLQNVMRAAVRLSIEMRTQKAEYIMLPPLQPEYDTNGDLARTVYFNASLMNERSGETQSNEELEQTQAIVRMVLFPLVVKKGGDNGGGDEEIVVCPAQVLVARPDKGKKPRRGGSGKEGDRERAQSRLSQAAMASTHSLGAMSGVEGNVI